MGGVALDLCEEANLLLAEVQPGHLLADDLFGKELGELEVEGARDLLQGFERRYGVAVLHAREITAQESGPLFDIALRHTPLKPIATDRCANVHRDRKSLYGRFSQGVRDCLHVSH